MTDALRLPAEQTHRSELDALKRADDGPKPAGWALSPKAVLTYVMGGETPDGTEISVKYFGPTRLIETAIATLATDRALLLLGVPGTAKSWVSEHLAAAIAGDSTLVIQGTSGTDEAQIRYGWNYAQLLAHGPSKDALVPSPLFRAMETGKICRIEELTRMGSDVQDALITVLSEKMLPIPEIDGSLYASKGFNLIATANDRDKGVNDLSAALKRRFNVVALPLPETADQEVAIVAKRVAEMAVSLDLPSPKNIKTEIERVVRIFRELRSGETDDGKLALKTPSGALSTAEAIGVVIGGLSHAAYFSDGALSAEAVSADLLGTIVKDPVRDKAVLEEYLELVLRTRPNDAPYYRALSDLV
ncbi:MAG: AAA family ATPase [Pseudomonadota bacterium]